MDKRQATFRFYEELNDFLPVERRKREFTVDVDSASSVEAAIESCGVPAREVDLVLVDGRSVDFTHRLAGGERVSAYPMFEAFDISPLVRPRPRPLREPRFAVDRRLERLAMALQSAGFDARWHATWDEETVIRISRAERRTILTSNPEMLRRGEVERGYLVRSTGGEAQLREVIRALQLESLVRPQG